MAEIRNIEPAHASNVAADVRDVRRRVRIESKSGCMLVWSGLLAADTAVLGETNGGRV